MRDTISVRLVAARLERAEPTQPRVDRRTERRYDDQVVRRERLGVTVG